MRVLVVEDEAKVAEALRSGLTSERFDVVVAASGEEGFFLLSEKVFDLVILDLGLPGRDGLDVLLAMRRGGMTTPVLVLTARDSVEDRIRGLDGGADDYLVKPFAFGELLARMRALMRRDRRDEPPELVAGDLTMDPLKRSVTRGSRTLNLTPREYDLLECLLVNAGSTVSRAMLARCVWDVEPGLIPLDNVIDVHMSRLRQKVGGDGQTKLIHTVRGVGFTIERGEP